MGSNDVIPGLAEPQRDPKNPGQHQSNMCTVVWVIFLWLNFRAFSSKDHTQYSDFFVRSLLNLLITIVTRSSVAMV